MRELRERKVYRLQAFFSPHFRWTYRTKTFVRVNKFQVSDEKIFRTNKLQKSTTRTVTFCVRSTSKYSFYTIYNIYGYVQAQYLSSYVFFMVKILTLNFYFTLQVIAFICGFIVIILMVLALASTDWLMAAGFREGLFLHCIEDDAIPPLPFSLDGPPGCYASRDVG